MKRFIVLILCAAVHVSAFAEPVSRTQAEQVAVAWLRHVATSPQIFTVLRCTPSGGGEHPAFYIVECAPRGMVIVAGDDIMRPVFMYSLTGNPRVAKPPQLQELLADAERSVTDARLRGVTAAPGSSSLWRSLLDGTTVHGITAGGGVQQLMTSTWNQTWPYNAYCPEDAGSYRGHVYVGCVATAMAQVMRYHGWPGKGKGAHSYIDPANPAANDPGYGEQSADFGSTTYQWKDMPDRLRYDTPEEDARSIATLMYHCGVAVNMNYGPQGSGANTGTVATALKTYFQYDESVSYRARSNYSDGSWNGLLRSNLDASQPIVYAGSGSGGHAFVLDGYDLNGYYHVNWGWGGSYDGWYYLDDLTPGMSNFTNNQRAVLDILPASWTLGASGTTSDLLAVDANGDAVWSCGGEGTVLRSTDAGKTWAGCTSPGSDYTLYSISSVNAQTAWVTGISGEPSRTAVWRSSDGGASWQEQLAVEEDGYAINAVDFQDEQNGVAYGDPRGGDFMVWTTSDGGAAWTQVPDAFFPDPFSEEHGERNNMSRAGNVVAFGTGQMQSGMTRVYYSTNGGRQWRVQIINANIGNTILSTARGSLEEGWALGTQGRISATTDGGTTWSQPISAGFTGLRAIAHGDGPLLAAVGEGGAMAFSMDGGQNWSTSMAIAMTANLNAIAFDAGLRCWAVGDGGAIATWIGQPMYMAAPGPPTPLSPDEGVKDQPLDPMFSWTDGDRAQTYTIEIAADAGFSSIVTQRSGVRENKAQMFGLALNTTYYWRVRSDNIGGSSAWSVTRSFTTVPTLPAAPSLVTPADGETKQPLSLVLSWQPVDGALTYAIEVTYEQWNVVQTQASVEGLTATSFTLDNLAYGTNYTWRVSAFNKGGAGPWSQFRSFRTIDRLTVPLLLTPKDHATGVAVEPLLYWSSFGAERFHVQVATSESFSNPVYDNDQVTASPLLVTGLQHRTRYYWRIEGIRGEEHSGWQEAFTFVTGSPLGVPTLSLPADGAVDTDLAPLLTWTGPSQAVRYHVQVATDDAFAQLVFDNTQVTGPPLGLPMLKQLTTHYWRVQASSGSDVSAWSETWSFTTDARLPAPVLLQPANGAVDVALAPVVDWHTVPGAERYHLQIARDDMFTDIVLETDQVTARPLAIPSLDPATTHFWRMRAIVDEDPSRWSTTWSFTTVIIPPKRVAGLQPVDGATGVSCSPTLSWEPAEYAEHYQLQLSVDAQFAGIVCDTSGIQPAQCATGRLASLTTHYWRVRGSNAAGEGPWSEVHGFTTEEAVPVTEVPLPSVLRLHQNYPNPFRPETTIRYTLPQRTAVTLVVTDILGQTVARLHDTSWHEAGTHSVRFDARGLPPGMYLYRLETSTAVQVKRMLLLR